MGAHLVPHQESTAPTHLLSSNHLLSFLLPQLMKMIMMLTINPENGRKTHLVLVRRALLPVGASHPPVELSPNQL